MRVELNDEKILTDMDYKLSSTDADRVNIIGILKATTPVDTGRLQSGWYYKVEDDEISIYNHNDWLPARYPVSLCRLLTYGHFNGKGGWTPPNPFLSIAMDEIMSRLNITRKEVGYG